MANSSTTIKTVPFHGHDLITIQDGETVRVAMKPICNAIGLGWQSQWHRIKRHPVLSSSIVVMTTQLPGESQHREIVTLPLEMLNGWLFGVDSNRVKPEIRESLLMYQRECFQALADYWQKGVAVNPRIPLTPEHQRGIQKAVGRRCFNLPESARHKAYKRIYSHLKDRFGVAKYDQIPDERYTEALGAVESYSFSGDFLEAEAAATPKSVKVIDIDQWLDMNFYIKHRQMDSRRILITAKHLIDSEYRSPCMRLIKELEAEGHDLSACRLEVASLRHHLESSVAKLEQVIGIAQGVSSQAVSFAR